MLDRKLLLSIVLAAGVILFAASAVYGANPHFRSVTAQLGSPQLIINATEVGLGSGATVTYVASANVNATAQCINGGNRNPSASNKSFSGEIESTATSQADASGKVSTELILPALPFSFCPSGQSSVVANATFTDVTLTDTTNGIVFSIPGTFAYTAP